jgi:uncharacterized membrane protein AbrB (regulator of aidB expression)
MPVRRGLCWRLVATAIGALLGVQFPLPWSGLLGAATAAAIANLLAGEAIGPRRWLQLAVQVALGCLIGTSLVPALANPVLLPAALAPTAAVVLVWGGGAALIARFGRMDLATALTTLASGGAGAVRRRGLVLALQLARGLGVLLVAAWLTQ